MNQSLGLGLGLGLGPQSLGLGLETLSLGLVLETQSLGLGLGLVDPSLDYITAFWFVAVLTIDPSIYGLVKKISVTGRAMS